MSRVTRGRIELSLLYCSGLAQNGAYEFLRVFQLVEGMVVRFGTREPHENPLQVINSRGNIMLADVYHKLLSAHTPNAPTMAFINASKHVMFGKDISHPEAEKADAVALSFLEFGRLVYPFLKPDYGFVDEAGMNMPSEADVEARHLTYILWANLFGPPYVQAYGREFLLGAPGWRSEELDDGSILYVLSPSFVNRWQVVRAREVRNYFHQKVADVRIYRPSKDECLD